MLLLSCPVTIIPGSHDDRRRGQRIRFASQVRIRSPPVGGFELRCVEARPAYAVDGQHCGWVTLEEKIILLGRQGGLRRSRKIRISPSGQRDDFSLCTSKFESSHPSQAVGLQQRSSRLNEKPALPGSAFARAGGRQRKTRAAAHDAGHAVPAASHAARRNRRRARPDRRPGPVARFSQGEAHLQPASRGAHRSARRVQVRCASTKATSTPDNCPTRVDAAIALSWRPGAAVPGLPPGSSQGGYPDALTEPSQLAP
jgi:hypothetical protein